MSSVALTINTYHGTRNRSKRAGGLGSIKYFVMHYTCGIGSAKNNCIYFATADRRASADWFIDKTGPIWEYNNILDGYYTYHCGDGKGAYGITNANSVGCEIVSAGEDFLAAQEASAHDLYEHICSILGRRLIIVRHYDASRKWCPAPYIDESKWAALKARIAGDAPQPAPQPAPKPSPVPTAKPKGKVAEFQGWLNRTYGYNLAVDNSFGPASRKHAVMALQTEINRQYGKALAVDGSFGPASRRDCPNIRQGMRGNITRILQGLLYARGFDPNGFDGSFGPGCASATREAQSYYGIKANAVAGKDTFGKLINNG